MPAFSTKKDQEQDRQIASVALALEALESLLVEKGILKDNEVMEKLQGLAQAKALDADLRLQKPIKGVK